jgi:hypothetical protein
MFNKFNFMTPSKFCIFFVFILLFGNLGKAQSPLPSFLDNRTPGVIDYVIPNNVVSILVEMAGAQGGSTETSCPFVGGKGQGLRFTLLIGYCASNQLRPGGMLRLITGERGQSVRAAPDYGGAGGGGGSGILYKAPGSNDWIILAAMGGGGGAAFTSVALGVSNCIGKDGKDAWIGIRGEDGGSATGSSGTNYPGGKGGENGNGGASPPSNISFGGGGFLSNGATTGAQSCTGKVGFPNGGARATCNILGRNYYGGFGFGGGGAGINSGGGGGGFSGGGGGGGENNNPREGGGGGSNWHANYITLNQGFAFKNEGDGFFRMICATGTTTPPISLASSTLAPREVIGCNVYHVPGLELSLNTPKPVTDNSIITTLQALSQGCPMQSATYSDSVSANSKVVFRTFTVADGGGNTAIIRQVITAIDPGLVTSISPSLQYACANTASGALTVSSVTGVAVSYQWFVSTTPIFDAATLIQGATAKDYTPLMQLPGTLYFFCRSTDACGTIHVAAATVIVTPGASTWYKDSDGDNYYDPNGTIVSCARPGAAYKLTGLLGIDCNDNDATIYPGAPEFCDGKDNNCNNQFDENCIAPDNVVYVKANATGANDGSSWANAFTKLQDALNAPRQTGRLLQIWVATGTYYPDEGKLQTNNNSNHFFQIKDSLRIYGSFVGNEISLSQRSLTNGITSILSGEIQQDGDDGNNSRTVVIGENLTSGALLDGFIIEKGYKNFALPVEAGRGAGIQILNSTNPQLANLIIRNNFAIYGSAITMVNSRPIIRNCVISGNTTFSSEGVVYNINSNPIIAFCTIAANSLGLEPVVIRNEGTSSPFINSSIVLGTTTAISGGTPNISYSIVQNPTPWPGTANSNADPLFVNEASGNLRLKHCSPAINTAQSVFSLQIDIEGTPRFADVAPDRGAYEYKNQANKLFVNAAAAPGGDGSSWATALRSLQDALTTNYCSAIWEIWVARGTYTPTTNTNRDSAFVMRNNLAIYGGFAGTETQLSQRNWRLNETILSGDIGVVGNTNDNSFSVVRGNGLNASAVIDGFTIIGGNANATGTIDGVIHTMNGGGIYLLNASPTISNCTLTNNTARVNGGAIHNITGSPAIRNCIFSDNQAQWGGAIYNEINASPAITNCVFYGNRGLSQGGALFNNSTSNPSIINTTFTGNSANQGLALANQFSSVPVVTNSILWETNSLIHLIHAPAPTITYSIVQGGFAGTGNLNADPLFIRMEVFNIGFRNADLRPLSCSPAINAGSNAALPSGTTTDLAGMPRTALTTVDMGAYERQGIAAPQVIFVDETATGNNDGTSWANAYRTLQAAAKDLNNCATGSTPTINIARGTYLINSIFINFDKVSARIIGGFPNGGGTTRNVAGNPVIIRGTVRVLKNVTIDGVRVER